MVQRLFVYLQALYEENLSLEQKGRMSKSPPHTPKSFAPSASSGLMCSGPKLGKMSFICRDFCVKDRVPVGTRSFEKTEIHKIAFAQHNAEKYLLHSVCVRTTH